MTTILLAGATGILGQHVERELAERGYCVRRIVTSNARPGDWPADLRRLDALDGAFEGCDAAISCAGAAMRLGNWRDRSSFHDVTGSGVAIFCNPRAAGPVRAGA